MSTEYSSQNLPLPVARLIQAIHDLDSVGLASTFGENAILVDEAKTYHGRPPIQEWCQEALVNHKATISVKETKTVREKTWLRIVMDGQFEADYGITEPFILYFHFTLQDDNIHHLRINDIAPDEPTMRAVWASGGNLENPLASVRNDVRRVPEVPKGWVKVKVAAVGLNYHDIITLKGLGMHKLTFPLTLGNEGVGFLEDGTEVIIFPVMGDRGFKGDVTMDPKRHVLGELTQGALAEYVVVPEENVIKKPKELSMLTASVLGIAYLTAYRMLFGRSGLKKGQKMLVQGSTGGVAIALIQLGRAAGMTVWCTGRTEEKRALARKLGAHQTFEAGEKLPEKVAAVFDMSGAQTWSHSIDSIGTGGTIVTCGRHSGGKVEMDLLKVFAEQINIRGVYAGNREEFEKMVALVAEHKIEPHIPVVLPLEEAKEGLRMILAGTVQGKVVVKL